MPAWSKACCVVAAALRNCAGEELRAGQGLGGQKLIRLTRYLGHDSLHLIGLAQQKERLQPHGTIKRAGVEAQLVSPLHFCASIAHPVQADVGTQQIFRRDRIFRLHLYRLLCEGKSLRKVAQGGIRRSDIDERYRFGVG